MPPRKHDETEFADDIRIRDIVMVLKMSDWYESTKLCVAIQGKDDQNEVEEEREQSSTFC
jgi:hypothetical protein